MKKTRLLLSLVLTLGLMDCFCQPKVDQGLQTNSEVTETRTVNGPKMYNMVIWDQGKMSFYNYETETLVPFEGEKDSVVTAVFVDNVVYYTVSINGKLYLKKVDLDAAPTVPVMVADWGMTLDECTEDGEIAQLRAFRTQRCINMGSKYYSIEEGTFLEDSPASEEEEYQDFLNSFMLLNYDYANRCVDEDGAYFYSENEDDELRVCLTDRMDFSSFVIEDEYDAYFEFLYVDPTYQYATFLAHFFGDEWEFAPLCMASFDGKIQLLLKDAESEGNWLTNGSLVYVGDGPSLKIVTPDGRVKVLSKATNYAVKEAY